MTRLFPVNSLSALKSFFYDLPFTQHSGWHPFYPFGRNDQQEVDAYLCHTAHMAAPSEIEAAFDFVTYNAARALRLHDYGLEPGCWADLNVLAAPTAREVLRLQQPPTWVIHQGQVLARNQVQRELMKRQGSGLPGQPG